MCQSVIEVGYQVQFYIVDLNSTVVVLEGRVWTIEGTVSDQEDRLTSTEAQIQMLIANIYGG